MSSLGVSKLNAMNLILGPMNNTRNVWLYVFIFMFSSLFFQVLQANAKPKPEQICIYKNTIGEIVQVNDLDKVPYSFRKQTQCFDAKENTNLVSPKDISLKGNIRVEDVSSPIGRVQIRWPRNVEQLFGRTPLKATTDAGNTVGKVIRTSAFPSLVQNLKLDWQVVFMDEKLPETQIPSHLIRNCHPGWMTPPANIYIVAQRAAGKCGNFSMNFNSSVADSKLAEILVHEMGHAVEFELLGRKQDRDLVRTEGFATWFEVYAADYSSIISKSSLKKEIFSNAELAIKQSPNAFVFSGTDLDYARGSMYFFAIVDRLGLRALVDVYKVISTKQLDFFSAIKEVTTWDRKQLEKEVEKVIKKA